MKTEIKAVVKERVYPYLGEWNNIVILFTAPKTGVLLQQEKYLLGGEGYKIGEVCPSLAEEEFKILNEEFIMSND